MSDRIVLPDFEVVCHDERHHEEHPDAPYGPAFHELIGATHPRSTSTLIGERQHYGALWHCPAHTDCRPCLESDRKAPRRRGQPRPTVDIVPGANVPREALERIRIAGFGVALDRELGKRQGVGA